MPDISSSSNGTKSKGKYFFCSIAWVCIIWMDSVLHHVVQNYCLMIVACNAIYLRWMAKLLCNWYQLCIFIFSFPHSPFVFLLNFFLHSWWPLQNASCVQKNNKRRFLFSKTVKWNVLTVHVSYQIQLLAVDLLMWLSLCIYILSLFMQIVTLWLCPFSHNIYIHNDDFLWTFHKYFLLSFYWKLFLSFYLICYTFIDTHRFNYENFIATFFINNFLTSQFVTRELKCSKNHPESCNKKKLWKYFDMHAYKKLSALWDKRYQMRSF